MRPDIDTPARRLTSQECFLHDLMMGYVQQGDEETAHEVRAQLRNLSIRRAEAAKAEAERNK